MKISARFVGLDKQMAKTAVQKRQSRIVPNGITSSNNNNIVLVYKSISPSSSSDVWKGPAPPPSSAHFQTFWGFASWLLLYEVPHKHCIVFSFNLSVFRSGLLKTKVVRIHRYTYQNPSETNSLQFEISLEGLLLYSHYVCILQMA